MTAQDYIDFLKTQGVDAYDMGAGCVAYTCENGSAGAIQYNDEGFQEWIDDECVATHDSWESVRSAYMLGATVQTLDGINGEVTDCDAMGVLTVDCGVNGIKHVALEEIAFN